MLSRFFGILEVVKMGAFEGDAWVKHIGMIDIGSNSIRLSIIRMLENDGYFVVDEHKSSPRLANLLSENATLEQSVIHKLISSLREFQDLYKAYGVEEIVALGTAALRAAINRDEIKNAVRSALGFEIDIITGHEEALLGYSAVMHTMEVDQAYLIDIGGASTEVSLVEQGKFVATHSFPFGAVTLSRKWNDSQAVSQSHLNIPKIVLDEFASHPFLKERSFAQVIGIGGTIRNIARIHQAAQAYPLGLTHNYEMTAASVEETLCHLAQLPIARRKKVDGLSKDRVDLIVPGGAILLALLRQVSAPSVRISGRGLRDGAFFTKILNRPQGPEEDILQMSIKNTLQRFAVPQEHASHVAKLALDMLSCVDSPEASSRTKKVLFAAAMLHRIGVQVSYYNYDQHTFYLIVSSAIYGLSHREILLTALAASYKGRGKMRKLSNPYRSLLSDDDLSFAARLGVIVRLAEALDRRHEGRIAQVTAKLTNDQFIAQLPHGIEADVEVAAAAIWAPHVKKVFDRKLEITFL